MTKADTLAPKFSIYLGQPHLQLRPGIAIP